MAKAKRNRTKRARPAATAEQRLVPIRFQIPRPEVTEYNAVAVVPQLTPESSGPSPSGSPGSYQVIFVLGVPGVNSVVDSVTVDDWVRSGDSLLASNGLDIGRLAEDGSPAGGARFVPNSERRLARVHLSVQADNFAVAEQYSHDAVMPILSLLAFAAAESAAMHLERTGRVRGRAGLV